MEASKKANTQEGDQGESTKQRKNNKNYIKPLTRPIFFICNDLYAKCLRKLRDLCLVVKVTEANPQRLLKRLMDICDAEGVHLEEKIIRDLCTASRFDARSCINALQYMKNLGPNFPQSQAYKVAHALKHQKDAFENIFQSAD